MREYVPTINNAIKSETQLQIESGTQLPNNYDTQQSKAESRCQTNTKRISTKRNQKLNTAIVWNVATLYVFVQSMVIRNATRAFCEQKLTQDSVQATRSNQKRNAATKQRPHTAIKSGKPLR